ncbi:sigma factor-like helix-turn-helix DNA-binding protein [Streptomyces sp. enrichment culture]|uniref:sigma factor-like helix-turn-helix DNA-binding protein n=1 Tax=Streptomyces sp. enrichment culture TaxID=1795815 RepID=UPI003F57EF00
MSRNTDVDKALLTAGATRLVLDTEPYADPPPRDEDPLQAALATLTRLSAVERAALILSEVLKCDTPDIASALGCSEEACHQLLTALSARTTFAWPKTITGPENVARALTTITPPLLRIGVTLQSHTLSNHSATTFRDRSGRALNALVLTAGHTLTLAINPDDLTHLDPVAEAQAALPGTDGT